MMTSTMLLAVIVGLTVLLLVVIVGLTFYLWRRRRADRRADRRGVNLHGATAPAKECRHPVTIVDGGRRCRSCRQLLEPISPEEYSAEALADRQLIRWWGWLDSALLHPKVLARRHKRHSTRYGVYPGFRNAVIRLAAYSIAGLQAGVVYMYTLATAEQYSIQRDPIADAIVAGVGGLVMAHGLVSLIRMRQRWSEAYTPVYVYEASDTSRPYHTTGVLQLNTPRLAWPSEKFHGSVLHGEVHVELPPGQRILQAIGGVRDVYGLGRCAIAWTHVPARETYEVLHQAARAGELRRQYGQSRVAAAVIEGAPWLITGIAVVGVVMLATG